MPLSSGMTRWGRGAPGQRVHLGVARWHAPRRPRTSPEKSAAAEAERTMRQRRVTPLIGRDRHARFRPPPAALRRRTAPLHAHRRPRPHALVQPGGHRARRHDARGGRPPAARGRAGHRQDHARPRAGPRDPGSRRAQPVHPRHAPLRHHGHLGLRSAGEGIHVLSRPSVRADRSCRRDTDPRRRQLPPARYAKRPWIQALASRASGTRGAATGPRTRRRPPR